jgi:hypothetical protein
MTLEAESSLSVVEIGGLPVDRGQPITATVTSENLPGQIWERIETLNDKYLTGAVISAGFEGPLIVTRYIRNNPIKATIDSSIRIPREHGSYVLRYDYDCADGYQDWQLIETKPDDNRNGNAKQEQIVFNRISTNPTFRLEDTEAPGWQEVLGDVVVLLSSLPDDYPEKEILLTAWQKVSVTDETTYIALDKQRELEEHKKQMAALFPPQKQPSFIQKVRERIALIIEGPNGYGSERSQPMPADIDINRRKYWVIR